MVVDESALKKYKCVLASFMSFVHNRSAATKYDKNHVFADEVVPSLSDLCAPVFECILHFAMNTA